MEILFFVLIGWSITSILVNGSIFDPLRGYLIVKAPFFSKLMTCMQCSGFWVGFFIGLLSCFGYIIDPLDNLFLVHVPAIKYSLKILSYSFLNSGISVLINGVMVFLVTREQSH